jgi:hypothetical protein
MSQKNQLPLPHSPPQKKGKEQMNRRKKEEEKLKMNQLVIHVMVDGN